jgi:hypothetical protein
VEASARYTVKSPPLLTWRNSIEPPSDQPRGSFRVWAMWILKCSTLALIAPRVATEYV